MSVYQLAGGNAKAVIRVNTWDGLGAAWSGIVVQAKCAYGGMGSFGGWVTVCVPFCVCCLCKCTAGSLDSLAAYSQPHACASLRIAAVQAAVETGTLVSRLRLRIIHMHAQWGL
jgi:hypothetical protein